MFSLQEEEVLVRILFLPTQVKLYQEVVDLRKGQQGLLGLVPEDTSDVLYLFSNRSRDLIKGLFWDRTGYVVISKRLERGKFSIPVSGGVVELDGKQLRLLLDGLKIFL